MSLTIYPATDYDSFISLADATTLINSNTLYETEWAALTDAIKEVYLRMATDNIFLVISTDTTDTLHLDSTTYVAADSCLPKSTALMAIHDIANSLSKTVISSSNGAITLERSKVGDLEVETRYYASDTTSTVSVDAYPASVKPCLALYGSTITTGGFSQATLVRS